MRLIFGTTVLPTDPIGTLSSAGIADRSLLTAFRRRHSKILWRGFEIGRFKEWTHVSGRDERHERVLLDVDGSCFFVSVDCVSDAASYKVLVVVWNVMKGTYDF